MKIDLGPEVEEFRQDIRGWLNKNIPSGLSELTDWTASPLGGGRRGATLDTALADPRYAEWEQKLLEARLICPHWPSEYGGQDLDALKVTVLNEEFTEARVPRVNRGMGESLSGPAILFWGTEEQKKAFLPPIVTGEHVYCQGFSEPSNGSDLGGLRTRGVIDGDEVVISGQKVWTSGAASANRMFVMCRTDQDAPKHKGLSYVLIDFTDPAVTYRRIKQMTGAAEFCEDFLDGVRAPLFNVIGGVNNGWKVAMTTLGFERGGSTVAYVPFERDFWALVEEARERGKLDDAVIRDRLAWAYTHVQLMRYSGLRELASVAAGNQPGPEASINKLFWSEYQKKFGELAMQIVGPEGLTRPEGDDYPISRWQNLFLASRAGTIFSGTSQVQRNIISERALGLPKEPSAIR